MYGKDPYVCTNVLYAMWYILVYSRCAFFFLVLAGAHAFFLLRFLVLFAAEKKQKKQTAFVCFFSDY